MFGKKSDPANPTPPSAPSDQQPPAPPPSDSGQAPVPSDASSHLPAVIEKHAEPTKTTSDLVEARAKGEGFATGTKTSAQAHEKSTSYVDKNLETEPFQEARAILLNRLVEQVDFASISQLERDVQRKKVFDICDKFIAEVQAPLNAKQVDSIKSQAMDELFGFGPLESLLDDPDVSDIMINGPMQIYVEKQGKIVLTDVTFMDETHLITIIQRIVSRVGRRVDEASPMVDARMPDGSRFNAIIPPLALDGSLVSIRKFKKNKMPLSAYVQYESMSEPMVKFLQICGLVGLNIMVSGGTGSGKTTLLNALSGGIGEDERIVTIEDAAELQLQQPHVLRLETRPASMEGRGEITQRHLVKNALRMRPDRIILGEIRGDEVIDVLSAMNTGHDGSMATIHANNARDCLARIENLVGMSSVDIPSKSLRQQIASAIQLIVQIERMRDGKRRITAIEEVVGLEGDIITTQTLFSYKPKGMKSDGVLDGEFICHGVRPHMLPRAEYFGKEREVLECFQVNL